MQISLRDELALRYALQQEFEADVGDFIRRTIRPGAVFVDLGANIGHFTLIAAKRVGSSGAVHAFEPAPEEYSKLCANVALNRLTNVVINRSAISDGIGEVKLQICGEGLGAYNSIGKPLNTSTAAISVPCATLDSYVQSAGIAGVDLLKIDVEGAELPCIRGGFGLLSRPDAPIIICEFCDATAEGLGYSTHDLRRHLEQLGYQMFRYSLSEQRLTLEPQGQRYVYDNLIGIKPGRLLDLACQCA